MKTWILIAIAGVGAWWLLRKKSTPLSKHLAEQRALSEISANVTTMQWNATPPIATYGTQPGTDLILSPIAPQPSDYELGTEYFPMLGGTSKGTLSGTKSGALIWN